MRAIAALCLVASVAAFAPASPTVPSRSAVSSSAVSMAAKKGVNPALFSTGIDPKTIAKVKAEKAAKAKAAEELTKKGFPIFSLGRVLPNRPGSSDEVRTDGSFKFARPWEKKGQYVADPNARAGGAAFVKGTKK